MRATGSCVLRLVARRHVVALLVLVVVAACSKSGGDDDDTTELGGSAAATPDSARLVGGANDSGTANDSSQQDTSGPRAATPVQGGAKQASQEGDEAVIERLEAEARALAKTAGCSKVAQCRAAPLGAKACGGPRDYLVYCALTTDSAKLYRKLAELEKAEKAYNAKSGMMSTCEMLLAPQIKLSGGQCRAGP